LDQTRLVLAMHDRRRMAPRQSVEAIFKSVFDKAAAYVFHRLSAHSKRRGDFPVGFAPVMA
jgi:3-deoxy-D-manno-octulosonic acid (KDO) 8-phosphate synthase